MVCEAKFLEHGSLPPPYYKYSLPVSLVFFHFPADTSLAGTHHAPIEPRGQWQGLTEEIATSSFPAPLTRKSMTCPQVGIVSW